MSGIVGSRRRKPATRSTFALPSVLVSGTRAAETADRKRRLLAAATGLAAEGGYDAVQMRDVAARAEVALGTLYRHYASKDQLLLAAMAQQAATLRERLDQRPAAGSTPPPNASPTCCAARRAPSNANRK